MAGVAALGATFSGTALAADQASDTGLGPSQLGGGYFAQDDATDGIGSGTMSGIGGDMVPFNLPSRGPSMTVPVKKNDDDTGSPVDPYSGFGHHDHHGAQDTYDYDLYQPTEHYDPNKCKNNGSSRAPIFATENGPAGYNGDSADDCKVDSGDYHPKRTGFQGDYDPNSAGGDNGYNGYLGSDQKKLDKNDYSFGAPGL
jgi:hypothetical protein